MLKKKKNGVRLGRINEMSKPCNLPILEIALLHCVWSQAQREDSGIGEGQAGGSKHLIAKCHF